jgi:NADPH-dependent curcumin reductase CurA
MRGRMNDVKSYISPFQIGEVLQAGVVGEVVASNFDGIAEGDHVAGMLGWENYSVSDGRILRKLPKIQRARHRCRGIWVFSACRV